MNRLVKALATRWFAHESVNVNEIMKDPEWRKTINGLVDILGCTRYRAARIVQAANRSR